MASKNLNSFKTRASMTINNKKWNYHSLPSFAKAGGGDISKLPFSLKILLENLLRHEDGFAVKKKDIEALAGWDAKAEPNAEIQFMPARVLLQDFTGVPAV
ncbi:MAG: aconitate hydratase, partial [Bdellovibrionia bacterium]